MQKITLIFLSLILSVCGVMAQKSVRISKYEGQAIHGLIADGVFDINLSQGVKSVSTITIESEFEKLLTYELTVEGYLRIGFKDDISKYFTSSKRRPQAVVVVSSLDYMRITGACRLFTAGKFTSDVNSRIQFSGATLTKFIDLTAPRGVVLDMSGTSMLEASQFNSADASVLIYLSGTCDANINVTCGTGVRGEISGVSHLIIKGAAPSSDFYVSGTSSVDMLGFEVPEQVANVTGVSKIKATVNGSAKVDVSGISSFRYTGTGVVTGSKAKRL